MRVDGSGLVHLADLCEECSINLCVCHLCDLYWAGCVCLWGVHDWWVQKLLWLWWCVAGVTVSFVAARSW